MRRLYVPTTPVLSLMLAALAFGAEPTSIGPPFSVPVDADGVQRTTVILDSYSYAPAHLIVEKGKPVEFTLKSVTTLTPHNFIIKDPGGSLSVEQDVSAGKTALLKFTPMQPGICRQLLISFVSSAYS